MIDSENNTGALSACPLGSVQLGFRGRICAIQSGNGSVQSVNGSDRPVEDLESRLIELGFVEGAAVEVLHEGLLGRDPSRSFTDELIAERRAAARAEADVEAKTGSGGS